MWICLMIESLWEHQGEAIITWGYGTKEMRCKVKR